MDPNIPNSPTDVLLLPGILLLFGVVVYGAGLANGIRDQTAPKYRWAGVVLVAFAMVIGALTVSHLYGPLAEFYRAMIGNRKVLLAHYVALGVPFVVLALVPVGEAWFRRMRQDLR